MSSFDQPTAELLSEKGASSSALAKHYEISTEYYAVWLAENLGYSCALWSDDPDQSLEQAEEAKIDFYAEQLAVHPSSRLLDVGCGWGGPAARLITTHRAGQVVALTLSPSHVEHCRSRRLDPLDVRLESWVEHEPTAPYTGIICFEALEHFAKDDLSREERMAVYSAFFERCYSWLDAGGRMGLQTNCFESIGYERAQMHAPLGDFLRSTVFPESSPPHLAEIVVAWEPYFAVRLMRADGDHYARTAAEWLRRLKQNRSVVEELIGVEGFQDSWKYLAGLHALYRSRSWTLYRVVLQKRRKLKR